MTKPILDTSSPAVKRLIEIGKRRGYITYDELNGVLPANAISSEDMERVIAAINGVGIQLVESHNVENGQSLAALAGINRFAAEPTLEGERRPANVAAAERYLSDVDARQGMYLTASGTLTQFNAILAAILGAALSAVTAEPLRIVIAVALLLHLWAAFALCWAARPIASDKVSSTALTLAARYHVTDHTFRTYRFGWRVTLAALAVSAVAAVLYVGQSFKLGTRLGIF